MRAGRWRGEKVTIQDVWEAVGASERGLLSRAELDALERVACPGPGTCAGHFTANTMAVALEASGSRSSADGLMPPTTPSQGGGRGAPGARGGARRTARGARVPGPAALPNAMTGIAATRRVDERRPAPARDRAARRASRSRSTS